ncbi:hypothetical protein CICLE_v10002536mg [Citrus x clementina]|uniref:t-SNARE coiled-coil domain-containing protein n=2 Tax=Citrus TaxID=2706 RepID=A0ACB8KIJ1_CITSI|nr:hypothetical protein CICLE_v10002536mg [Citrus x clementina]KAH9754250.1 t-SNARE coiled-coil domain-containing protein [Citrus sinensis]
MANKQYLVVDAWLREAQEAEKLVEEIDGRVKNKSQEQQQQSLSDDIIARSKLLEVGVKLDRLESLLRNPPSKPIFNLVLQCIYRTNEDLESRWKMLSDIQLRMKALAVRLYAMPYPMPRRQGGLPAADTRETDINADSYDQGQIRASFAKDESELLQPLVAIRRSSFISMTLLWKICWTIGIILGAAAFLFILFILCAVI